MDIGKIIKPYLNAAFGVAGTSGTIGLMSIDKMLAFLCGITTLITLLLALVDRRWSIKRDRIELAERMLSLCKQCHEVNPLSIPAICPFKPNERPTSCPHCPKERNTFPH